MAKQERFKRTPMPERAPEERRNDFMEVPLGYSTELAVAEASRCLQCKNSPCVAGCPVEIDIPGFIKLIRDGDPVAAARHIKLTNTLPAICGRVCPQETQCEAVCVLAKKGAPIAIGNLERFAASMEAAAGVETPPAAEPNGHKVAVVGSGPAGLTCAGELARRGYDVTIYEAFHVPGGVLVYGIPEFRLPKDEVVAAEVDFLRKLGVRFVLNTVIGRTVTIDELFDRGVEAVFVGSGAGAPMFLDIPGENAIGVYSANEYLTRTNLMKAYRFPKFRTPIARGKRVAVIGGGNVAMDSARTALRLGADTVLLLYRRSEKELPARLAEIHHAREEGVEFHLLVSPTRILEDAEGRVTAIECQKMELGEPDDSGRRRPVPIDGAFETFDVDLIVVAIGNRPNPLIPQTTDGLKISRWGTIEVDDKFRTSRQGIFAGGDIVTGAATVIEAMGAGRTAARSIDEYVNDPEHLWK
ncbi:MAG: NADPH-dependent glutamate synthase [Planctomycetes bacterium]|nr:NADPH-dependent glutamate synthase [Planctomycetota bacterium]